MSDKDLIEAVRKDLLTAMASQSAQVRQAALDSLSMLRIADALEKLATADPLPPGRG